MFWVPDEEVDTIFVSSLASEIYNSLEGANVWLDWWILHHGNAPMHNAIWIKEFGQVS